MYVQINKTDRLQNINDRTERKEKVSLKNTYYCSLWKQKL